jgi:uncharacterized membrane protein YfcA
MLQLSPKTLQENKKHMDLQLIIILLLIGLAAGALSGIAGVGGGIIIIPCLVYFLGFSQKMAQGTSLGILLLPVGILGVMQFYKQGYVDMRVVLIISAAFLFGSYFGSKLALSISQETLKRIFAVFLLIIAVKMLFFDKKSTVAHQNNITTQQDKIE